MKNIVIVGCGIVGSTIAYELSLNSQLNITVIEEKNIPGLGSTGAALGILMGVISKKTKGRAWNLREQSIQRYQSLIVELETKTGIKIPKCDRGILKLLFAEDNKDKWQNLQQVRHTQGWELEIWDREKLHTKCPHINYNSEIIGAVYSPQDKQINPKILTRALVEAATQNGVRFLFNTKVEKLISLDNYNGQKKCNYIIGDRGKVDIDYLIISAGLGSTKITESLDRKIDIRPVLGQAIKFKLDNFLGLEDFQPVITGDDIHIIPIANKEYWLGATVEFSDDSGNVLADDNLLAEIQDKAISFCPALSKAKILETWSGKRPRPQGQSAPIIKKLDGYDNVLLATAHYRNGVLLAPATAMEVLKLVATF